MATNKSFYCLLTIHVVIVTLFVSFVFSDAQGREWKRKEGGTYEADLNGLSDDSAFVFLRFPDGSQKNVSIHKFTTKDQLYIKNFYHPRSKNGLIEIRIEGYGANLNEAVIDAQRRALAYVNGQGIIGGTKVLLSSDSDDDIKEEYQDAVCGFIKTYDIVEQGRQSDGLYHAIVDIRVYKYVLDSQFVNSLSNEENVRRNDSINDQILFIKKLMGRYDFLHDFVDFKFENFKINNADAEFDCITYCDPDKYFEFSKHLIYCLDHLAINGSSFCLNAEDFHLSGYPGTVKFHCSDINENIPQLRTDRDRIFLCICSFYSQDYKSTRWKLYELPRKFMFLLEPLAHLMHGVNFSLQDEWGGEVKSLPPLLPDIRPYAPRCATFAGIWNARFRTRMKDEAVKKGSTFAVFNPNTPYNYSYVYDRFLTDDKLLNPPYCRVYSIQPFFLSAFPDKTNLIFPQLNRHITIPLSAYEKSKVKKPHAEIAPITTQGSQYFLELDKHLRENVE